jgi:hypothetical protein
MKEVLQKLIVPVSMKQSPSPIMNDEVHLDGDHFKCPNIHNKLHGGNDNDDDDAKNEDHVHCLSSILPNTGNNPVEYVYTRDSTGRVVSMEACLKVPRKDAAVMEATVGKSRRVISWKPSFKENVDVCVNKSAEDTTTTKLYHVTTNEHYDESPTLKTMI